MSEETKLCPFCGKPALISGQIASCSDENCEMFYVQLLDTETWQTRPIEDGLRARVAELEGILSGDPHLTATKDQREAWRLSAIRYADKVEAELQQAQSDAALDRMNCASWEQQAEDCMRREREIADERNTALSECDRLQHELDKAREELAGLKKAMALLAKRATQLSDENTDLIVNGWPQSASSGWILVSERMPADGPRVFVYDTACRDVFKAYHAPGLGWIEACAGEKLDDVLCWMPLPKLSALPETARRRFCLTCKYEPDWKHGCGKCKLALKDSGESGAVSLNLFNDPDEVLTGEGHRVMNCTGWEEKDTLPDGEEKGCD
jgi:hypothetical protein